MTRFFSLLLLLSFMLVGCSSDQTDSVEPNPEPPTDSTVENKPVETLSTEEEARHKLTVALDSWVFEDLATMDDWKEEHPNVILADERWGSRPFGMPRPVTVLKYEISSVRERDDITDKTEFGYQFIVILSIQNASKEDLTRRLKYNVAKSKSGTWAITARPA